MTFREDRATALAYRFVSKAGNTISHKKLMKLMYLVERNLIVKSGRQVTRARLRNMDDGPMLSEVYDCMKRTKSEFTPEGIGGIWRRHLSQVDNFQIRITSPMVVEEVLTEQDITLTDAIWDEYGSMTEAEIIEYTHSLPEFSPPDGTSEKIDLYEIFEGSSLTRGQILDRLARVRYAAKLDEYLSETG